MAGLLHAMTFVVLCLLAESYETINHYHYFYLQETHVYRSLLKMVEFHSVAQETKPCQLFTPPLL